MMTETIQFRWLCRVALWFCVATIGIFSLPTFAYDYQSRPEVEARINYDDSCRSAIDYYRAALPTGNENGAGLEMEQF